MIYSLNEQQRADMGTKNWQTEGAVVTANMSPHTSRPHVLDTGCYKTRQSVDRRTVCRSARESSRDPKESSTTRRRPRPAGVPRSSDTIFQTLDMAETVVLGAATAAGLKVALDSSPNRRSAAQQDRGVDASSAASTSSATTALSSLVLVSLILRKVSSRLVERRRQASPTSQAMQRLQNVEVAVEREGRVLEGALRDMDGLKMRSRLVGREVKEVRKVVEGVELGYGELGRVVEARMGEMQGQVSDLEGLTSSIHGVMAKQVGLISGVVTKVRDLERDVVVLKQDTGEVETGVMKEPQQQKQQQEEERKQEREVVVRQEVVTREKDGTVLYTWDSPA